MWPFKKEKKIGDLDANQQKWSVIQTEMDSGPLIIRKNDTAEAWKAHSQLGIKVGFAIPLNIQNKGGFPDPDENIELDKIEDGLFNLMEETGYFIQVLVLTTGEFKEIVFYMGNPDKIGDVHEKAISMFPSHEIQCSGEHDSEWKAYDQWNRK